MIAGLKSLLATTLGTALAVSWTLLFSILTIFAGAVRWRRAVDVLIRTWARMVAVSSGVRVRRSGRANSGPVGSTAMRASIIMANHTSLYDIPALIVATPWPIRFLAKKELFAIPFFGWALRGAGFVPVDRGRSRGGANAFAAARRALNSGVSLVIFPEETRSTDGSLGPFRAGGALLATATSAPVVPVGIRGAFDVRQRDSWRIRPGTISVDYGTPLDPADFTDRKQLNAAVRAQVEALTGQKTTTTAGQQPAAEGN